MKRSQKFIELNGRKPSNNEIARLVRDTRPDKLTEISTAEVKAAQLARLDAEEAQTLKQLRPNCARTRLHSGASACGGRRSPTPPNTHLSVFRSRKIMS